MSATPSGPGSGRRRAQLVLTVGNLDTGQIASASVASGAVEPVPTPGGGWWLPFRPIVTDLAERAGVAAGTLHDPDFPDEPGRLPLAGVTLPRQWRPDLPTGQRHQLEAAAIAARIDVPWLVLLGRSTEPEPPDHPRLLGRLCALADQLHVDLVVEARTNATDTGLSWAIRLELPGGGVPAHPHRRAGDLLAAIATSTAEQAVTGLVAAGDDTPAYFLAEHALQPRPAAVGVDGYPGAHDLDQLERRILRDAEQNCGAQAIWRNRHWWHTSLRPGEPAGTLRRGWEPPGPHYWGDPVPSHPCLRCQDTGDQPYCPDCYGTGRIWRGAVLTVTDLRGRCVHRNWRADDDPRPPALVASYAANGTPVIQLPDHYQVGRLAGTFDVRPADLTDLDGETVIDQHLRDGIIHLADPAADPVTSYLAEAAAGHHGARIMVRASDWVGPTLADLARLVLGLGLAIEITVTDHRLNAGNPQLLQGESWAVQVVDPASELSMDPMPTCAGLPEAVARCLRYLGGALRATIPTDPAQPIRVPQQPASAAAPPDTAGCTARVRRLAAENPGRPATARLDTAGQRTAFNR